MNTFHGVIKYVNAEKGYGFIAPDAGGLDVLFGFSQMHGIPRTPQKGEAVVYEQGIGKRGLLATSVYCLTDASAVEDLEQNRVLFERAAAEQRQQQEALTASKEPLLAASRAWRAKKAIG